MTVRGIDYAFSPHPPAQLVKAAGITFVCRYMSALAENDGNGKNLLKGELAELLGAGLSVVVVEESAAGRMKAGKAAGIADGQHALAVTAALGMPDIPVYFACDFDAAPGDQTAINAYLDGAASVIGRGRTGIYGGYWPLVRAAKAGTASWFWQTSAWSGDNVPGHPDDLGGFTRHIYQQGSVKVAGIAVDFDQAMTADYGQHPRPAAPAPAAPAAPAPDGLKQAVAAADVRLSWNAVPGQDTYHLQVEYYKQGFGWVLQVDEQVTGAYTAKGLAAGKYRWRAAAGAADHVWSAWKEFEV